MVLIEFAGLAGCRLCRAGHETRCCPVLQGFCCASSDGMKRPTALAGGGLLDCRRRARRHERRKRQTVSTRAFASGSTSASRPGATPGNVKPQVSCFIKGSYAEETTKTPRRRSDQIAGSRHCLDPASDLGCCPVLFLPSSSICCPARSVLRRTFETYQAVVGHPLVKLVLIGLLWAFLPSVRRHPLPVPRHSQGLELETARATAKATLVVSIALTLLIGVCCGKPHRRWRPLRPA